MKIPRNWTFENKEVAKGFDRHVREQLPWYDIATGAIAHIARHYIREGGRVYDVGASTGNIGHAIAKTIKERHAELIGIEKSFAMCEAYSAPGRILNANAVGFDYQPCCFAVAFLTVQFIPVPDRPKLLLDLFGAVEPGGALVVFDKLGVESRSYVATVMRRLTLAGKASAGTPSDEIIAKELSLGGVQRPLDEALIDGTSTRAFKWFQFGEFAGWLLEK